MSKAAHIAARTAAAEARGVIGTRLAGARKDLTKVAAGLVAVAGDSVRQEICGDPEFVKEFAQMLKHGASRAVMDRTCINAVMHVMKLVGDERKLVVEFVHSLGVKGEGELKRMVERVKGAESADLLTSIDRCVAFLEGALPMHEEHRHMVIRRLGGYLPVTSDNVGGELEAE